jgi:YihY family inner membrane protein
MKVVWIIFRHAVRKFYADEGTFLASGLAFGLLVYCIPFALLSVSILSLVLASSTAAFSWLRELSLTLIPHSHNAFDEAIVALVRKRALLSAFGFVAFIFASSTTFGSVRLVLNRVFHQPESRGVIRGKLMEIVLMLGTSLVIFVFADVVYLINVAHGMLTSFRYEKFIHPGIVALGSVVAIASTFALFWFLYHFSPAETLSRKGLLVAAGSATALFQISKWAFGVYVVYAKTTTALYGALSAAVFFLFWLYYSSVVFIFAAELGWSFDRHSKESASWTPEE